MPFVRKFWKPKESIPTTSTLPAAASPTHPSAPSPAPEEPLTDAVGRHLDQPSALFTSPPFVNDTDIQLQPTKLAAAFAALSEAYRVCSDTILDSDRFASTECGQEFERCIDDRIYGLSFDLQTLEARVTGYAAPVDGPVMSAEQKEIAEQELILLLRQVEDRLRRLRAEALQAVADHPSLLRKKMKDGKRMTHEEKIRSELTKAHESYKAGVERLGVSTSIEV